MSNPSVKNYDLKSVSKLIGTTIATLGIGVVPDGMKRYVTLIKAANVAGQQNVLYLASHATGSTAASTDTLASAAQRYSVQLPADGIDQFPNTPPSLENPLFSLAAGTYLNAKTNKGNMRVFIQYYDM